MKNMIRVISIIVTACFLYQDIIWTQPVSQMIGLEMLNIELSQPSLYNLESIIIPEDIGKIKEIWNARAENNGKVIFHIQDSHANYQAQLNIARILEYLLLQKQKDKSDTKVLIALEGAEGLIDTLFTRTFYDKEIKRAVTDSLMKEGLLTGAEFFSILSPPDDYDEEEPFVLWGVEDKDVYLKNLELFKILHKKKAPAKEVVAGLDKKLKKTSENIFNPSQKQFINIIEKYRSDDVGLEKYALFLAERLSGITSIYRYPNFNRLMKLIRLKGKVDFSLVEEERIKLIKKLKEHYTREDITEIITRGLNYQVGKVSAVDYYTYLKDKAKNYIQELQNNIPNLLEYTKYVKVESMIDRDMMFKELRAIEDKIVGALFVLPEQKELYSQRRNLSIVKNFIGLKIYREELTHYKENSGEFLFAKNIDTKDQFTLKRFLAVFEEFCDTGIERDRILAENTIEAMERFGTNTAVVITGGFHTEGITDLFRREDISHMVISPRMTRADHKDKYISLMLQEKSPLEKILAFKGTKLALAVSLAENIFDWWKAETARLKLEAGYKGTYLAKYNPLINGYRLERSLIAAHLELTRRYKERRRRPLFYMRLPKEKEALRNAIKKTENGVEAIFELVYSNREVPITVTVEPPGHLSEEKVPIVKVKFQDPLSKREKEVVVSASTRFSKPKTLAEKDKEQAMVLLGNIRKGMEKMNVVYVYEKLEELYRIVYQLDKMKARDEIQSQLEEIKYEIKEVEETFPEIRTLIFLVRYLKENKETNERRKKMLEKGLLSLTLFLLYCKKTKTNLDTYEDWIGVIKYFIGEVGGVRVRHSEKEMTLEEFLDKYRPLHPDLDITKKYDKYKKEFLEYLWEIEDTDNAMRAITEFARDVHKHKKRITNKKLLRLWEEIIADFEGLYLPRLNDHIARPYRRVFEGLINEAVSKLLERIKDGAPVREVYLRLLRLKRLSYTEFPAEREKYFEKLLNKRQIGPWFDILILTTKQEKTNEEFIRTMLKLAHFIRVMEIKSLPQRFLKEEDWSTIFSCFAYSEKSRFDDYTTEDLLMIISEHIGEPRGEQIKSAFDLLEEFRMKLNPDNPHENKLSPQVAEFIEENKPKPTRARRWELKEWMSKTFTLDKPIVKPIMPMLILIALIEQGCGVTPASIDYPFLIIPAVILILAISWILLFRQERRRLKEEEPRWDKENLRLIVKKAKRHSTGLKIFTLTVKDGIWEAYIKPILRKVVHVMVYTTPLFILGWMCFFGVYDLELSLSLLREGLTPIGLISLGYTVVSSLVTLIYAIYILYGPFSKIFTYKTGKRDSWEFWTLLGIGGAFILGAIFANGVAGRVAVAIACIILAVIHSKVFKARKKIPEFRPCPYTGPKTYALPGGALIPRLRDFLENILVKRFGLSAELSQKINRLGIQVLIEQSVWMPMVFGGISSVAIYAPYIFIFALTIIAVLHFWKDKEGRRAPFVDVLFLVAENLFFFALFNILLPQLGLALAFIIGFTGAAVTHSVWNKVRALKTPEEMALEKLNIILDKFATEDIKKLSRAKLYDLLREILSAEEIRNVLENDLALSIPADASIGDKHEIAKKLISEYPIYVLLWIDKNKDKMPKPQQGKIQTLLGIAGLTTNYLRGLVLDFDVLRVDNADSRKMVELFKDAVYLYYKLGKKDVVPYVVTIDPNVNEKAILKALEERGINITEQNIITQIGLSTKREKTYGEALLSILENSGIYSATLITTPDNEGLFWKEFNKRVTSFVAVVAEQTINRDETTAELFKEVMRIISTDILSMSADIEEKKEYIISILSRQKSYDKETIRRVVNAVFDENGNVKFGRLKITDGMPKEYREGVKSREYL